MKLKSKSLVFSLLLLTIVFAYFLLSPIGYRSQNYVGQVIVAELEDVRSAIAAKAEKRNSLLNSGTGIAPTTSADELGLNSAAISEDGVITGMNLEKNVVIVLTPTLAAGKVTWKCRGTPSQLVPAACRT